MRPHALAQRVRAWLLPMVAILMAGCQAAAPSTTADPAGTDEATRVLAQVRAAIGDAACSSDAQCRTLPMGARACGGPAAWWAWSTQRSDGALLHALATRLHTLERERIERAGLLSTCIAVPDPGAACVAARCTLNPRGAAR